jgi:endogenous inhibitor of DNA gyrase (YacG/DUF329 family)
MAKSHRLECGFCFYAFKHTPLTLEEKIICKRCGQQVDWKDQIEPAYLDFLTAKTTSSTNRLALDQEIPHGQFGFNLKQMPWQVRTVAVFHGVMMFVKGTQLIALLVANKLAGPGPLLYELFTFTFAGYTFYGVHYRSRNTWLALKNLGKLFMYLATIVGILLLIASIKRPLFLAALPIFGLLWLYFSMDYLLLRTKPAREFFRVVCPSCGSLKTKPADSPFTKVCCKECAYIWE